MGGEAIPSRRHVAMQEQQLTRAGICAVVFWIVRWQGSMPHSLSMSLFWSIFDTVCCVIPAVLCNSCNGVQLLIHTLKPHTCKTMIHHGMCCTAVQRYNFQVAMPL